MDLLQTWFDAELGYAPQFDSSLNDLDVYSRSHDYEEARMCSPGAHFGIGHRSPDR